MYLKGLFAGKPASFHLFVFVVLVLTGALLASVCNAALTLLLYGNVVDLFQHPDLMRWEQLLSSVCIFLLPAWGMAWLCSNEPKKYLFIDTLPDIHLLLWAYLCMFLLNPFIALTEFVNRKLVLPEFLGPLEIWMQNQEEAAARMTDILLAGNDVVSLLFNLLVIALAAGITEEFLFRGALLRLVGKSTANHHMVIWISAILFSAFHLQFYGFLPRMIMGAYLGYILYWSRNIWIPVFIHFMNNAIIVIGKSSDRFKDAEFFSNDLPDDKIIFYVIVAIVTLAIYLPLTKKLKKVLLSKNKQQGSRL